jgi:uncharacterized protein YoxC
MDQKQQGNDTKMLVSIVLLVLVIIAILFLLAGSIYIVTDLSKVSDKLESQIQDTASLLQMAGEMNEHIETLQRDLQIVLTELETLSDDVGTCRSEIEILQTDVGDLSQDMSDTIYWMTEGESPTVSYRNLITEIEYRLGIYIRILEENAESMTNEYAVQLDDGLRGWYIDGKKEFEGVSTISLITELLASHDSYEFLRDSIDDLSQLGSILQERTGERMAGEHQEMDYDALSEILERLKIALQAIQTP